MSVYDSTGGCPLFYKRTEYFRYVFGKPHEARFRIIMEEETRKQSGVGDCSLIDLSIGGAKVFAKYNIPFTKEPIKIVIEFSLFKELIEVEGVIVWKSETQNDNGYLYGFEFEAGEEKEELIISELKLLAKSEVKDK